MATSVCLVLLCFLTNAGSIKTDLIVVFLIHEHFVGRSPLINSSKMMEVDTHSPSTIMTRSFNYSLKRPRSPGSPSQERQPKRSSVALQDAYLSRRASSSVNQSSSNHHQPSPDDWVRQASDLSIGRPNSVDPVPSPSVTGDVQDENMALDPDEPSKSCSSVLVFSLPRLLQPSRTHPTTTQSNAPQACISPPQHLSQIIVGPADGQPLTPSITMAHEQHLSSVYVQSGISSDGSSNQQESQSGSTQSHDFFQTTSSEMPIPPLPPISQSPGPKSTSGRKQRFTMGPRADCLKCRMGEKGHWMHFD